MRGEARHAERIQPRGNRHRLPPMRSPLVPRKIDLFDQRAIGHDLILRRGGHDELAGGLVVGWSIVGSHCRARLGQFSLNALRSPWMLLMSRSPSAGTPR